MNRENKNRWIDVGTIIEPELVVWPGDPHVEIQQVATIGGDGCNITRFSMSAHAGTHMDAPFHYLDKGRTIEQLDPERMIGQANVYDFAGTVITAELLLKIKIGENDNIIFKTSNSSVDWSKRPFSEKYVSLDESAAHYLADRRVNLVGIDYLSIADAHHGEEVHKILLKADILIIEGLMLQNIQPGRYELICLPLKLKGADGAPVRVLLRNL